MPITVYSEDNATQIEDVDAFKKKYTLITAAGGAVQNDNGEVLMIFRKGKWDLPKGKLEGNEPIELCAHREVKEETGLVDIMLRKPLLVTYHTYTEKGKDILKETHWYLFDAPGKQSLTPQTEEDISQAKWIPKAGMSDYMNNTYTLIKDVLNAAGF